MYNMIIIKVFIKRKILSIEPVLNTCKHACTHTCMHTRMRTHIHAHKRMHACTHTHTHMQTDVVTVILCDEVSLWTACVEATATSY